MARSKKESSKGKDAGQRALTITGILVVTAAVLTAGAIVGIRAAWNSIAARPEFLVQPGNVDLDPSWVRLDEMKKDFVVSSTPRNGRSILSRPASIFEDRLSERVAAAYGVSPWVRRVIEVRRDFPNTMAVKLDLRLPYAIVQWSGNSYCVSEDAVVLDKQVYQLTPDKLSLLQPVIVVPSTIRGPVARQQWNEAAVIGGLEMVRLCQGKLSGLKVSRVEVRMLDQRASPQAVEAYLVLENGPLVHWGRTPNSPTSGFEVPTQTKIASLLAVAAREKDNISRLKEIDVRDAKVLQTE